MVLKLLSDRIQEFIDWLEMHTDFADWHPSMKVVVQKKLIDCMLSQEESKDA